MRERDQASTRDEQEELCKADAGVHRDCVEFECESERPGPQVRYA